MKKFFKVVGWCALVIIAVVLLLFYVESRKNAERAAVRAAEFAKTHTVIPNVMGLAHGDAKAVLEREGHEVTEIEADASSILGIYSYWLNEQRSVKKGEVFKVNDVLRPDYTERANNPYAKDNHVTIYYAKRNYVPDEPDYAESDEEETEDEEAEPEPEPEEDPESTPTPTLEPKKKEAPVKEAKATPAPKASTTVEWKQFLKDYEAWVDSYIALMAKYEKNPTDITILADYTASVLKLAEWAEKAEAMEDALDDDPAALKEYLAMLARIVTKLSKIA